jgi:hypothetical protein
MIAASRVALALLLTGVGLGTVSPSDPPRVVSSAGEFSILTGDFHVHAVPGDGGLTPGRVQEEARYQRLDVVALTNHNQLLAALLLRWTAAADPPLVLMGAEITNPAFHLIAVGITDDIDWRQPAAAVIDAVHAQGGIAVAAHPTRRFWAGWDDDALARLDGVEVAHPARHQDAATDQEFDLFFDRVRRVNPDVAPIGSSDYHATGRPGTCRTYLFARNRTKEGVLEAIRDGRTVAEDARGRRYGDPDLVQLVAGTGATGHVAEASPLGLLSIVSAWIGIAGVLLLGGRARAR